MNVIGHEEPERICVRLEYDLFTLPSAQHKAGLAGLVMMVDWMRRKGIQPCPNIEETPDHRVVLHLEQDSLQAMLDHLYDAERVEISVKKRWPKQEPKRTESIELPAKSGKSPRSETRYIYDVVQPKGSFLKDHYPAGGDAWLKLWRDMLWNTLRAQPTTRRNYNERADGSHVPEAVEIWERLLPPKRNRQTDQAATDDIAGSICLGAQNVNAEMVPFKGKVAENLLLHFWTLPSLVFSPRLFSNKGEWQEGGFVVVVPEPSDLDNFIREISGLLRALETQPDGFYPRAARINLPEEGGLEYLYQLTREKIRQNELAFTLSSIDVFHVQKRGNNVRILQTERLVPSARILREYEALRQACRNPFFKSVRIRALLTGEAWFHGMEELFDCHPWTYFIWRPGQTPGQIPFFGFDIRDKLKHLAADLQLIQQGGEPMTEEIRQDLLADRVYRLIRTFVNSRTEDKSGLKFSEFRGKRDEQGRVCYPEKYREAKEKICSDAFLAMRGRRDQDFIAYFVGTVCAVPQFLPQEDYLAVSQALLSDWPTVKTLAMLALSACSYSGGKTESPEEKGEES